jgi:hypothetical protein
VTKTGVKNNMKIKTKISLKNKLDGFINNLRKDNNIIIPKDIHWWQKKGMLLQIGVYEAKTREVHNHTRFQEVSNKKPTEEEILEGLIELLYDYESHDEQDYADYDDDELEKVSKNRILSHMDDYKLILAYRNPNYPDDMGDFENYRLHEKTEFVFIFYHKINKIFYELEYEFEEEEKFGEFRPNVIPAKILFSDNFLKAFQRKYHKKIKSFLYRIKNAYKKESEKVIEPKSDSRLITKLKEADKPDARKTKIKNNIITDVRQENEIQGVSISREFDGNVYVDIESLEEVTSKKDIKGRIIGRVFEARHERYEARKLPPKIKRQLREKYNSEEGILDPYIRQYLELGPEKKNSKKAKPVKKKSRPSNRRRVVRKRKITPRNIK